MTIIAAVLGTWLVLSLPLGFVLGRMFRSTADLAAVPWRRSTPGDVGGGNEEPDRTSSGRANTLAGAPITLQN